MQEDSVILTVISPGPASTAAPRYPMRARVGNRPAATGGAGMLAVLLTLAVWLLFFRT